MCVCVCVCVCVCACACVCVRACVRVCACVHVSEYLDPQDMYWSLCSSHDLTCRGVCCLVVTPRFPCDNDSCTCNNSSNSLAIIACKGHHTRGNFVAVVTWL